MKLFFLLAAALACLSAAAQDYGQAATIRIWDNATAPHDNGLRGTEREYEKDRISGVTDAVLYLFPADEEKATGKAVVICPGGGYEFLSMDTEGYLMARWFAEHGITAAVLKYRMPNGHPEVPLEDAVQALRIMSGLEAGATGFTPDRVGIAGCSAGGHLAAAASVLSDFKPAFTVLFYPVVTADAGIGHQGSFNALLGGGRSAASDAAWSPEKHVTAEAPPAMILLSDDNDIVAPVNGPLYYDALKAQGVKASMHIYPSGGHGWGCRSDFPYREQWQQAVLEWLGTLGE